MSFIRFSFIRVGRACHVRWLCVSGVTAVGVGLLVIAELAHCFMHTVLSGRSLQAQHLGCNEPFRPSSLGKCEVHLIVPLWGAPTLSPPGGGLGAMWPRPPSACGPGSGRSHKVHFYVLTFPAQFSLLTLPSPLTSHPCGLLLLPSVPPQSASHFQQVWYEELFFLNLILVSCQPDTLSPPQICSIYFIQTETVPCLTRVRIPKETYILITPNQSSDHIQVQSSQSHPSEVSITNAVSCHV